VNRLNAEFRFATKFDRLKAFQTFANGAYQSKFRELLGGSWLALRDVLYNKKSPSALSMDLRVNLLYADDDFDLATRRLLARVITRDYPERFQHFRKAHPNETEPERLDRFKKWYLDMADKMQKEGVIGGVQAVDTATGAHAHLPPGQGILPVVEAVTNLKKKGFKGFIVSEGHEEEGFGAGRIVTETWRAFGAHAGYNVYNHPVRWSDVSNTHWGYAAPPNYIVGAYAPSNEWKLWSEVPFE